MLAVLALPHTGAWWERALCAGLAATAVEYAVHWAYERVFAVRFWDYRTAGLDFHGRVCLPFSVAWAFLALTALTWIHPPLCRLLSRVGDGATNVLLLALAADALSTSRVLLTLHDIDALTVRAFVNILQHPCAPREMMVE